MRIARERRESALSGGSRNKRPLVGNTGGASPCVRVFNRPGADRANAGVCWVMVSDELQKAFNKKYRKDIKQIKRSQELLDKCSSDADDDDDESVPYKMKSSEERQRESEELNAQIEQIEQQVKREYWDSVHVVLSSKRFWVAQILLIAIIMYLTVHFL
jgi:hypothetical protein